MKPGFRDLSGQPPTVTIRFDGQDLHVPNGANLAAALLAAGITALRHSPVSGAPRAPFCMMGACYDCLVDIDGVTRQACMTEIQPGLIVTRPGLPEQDE